MLISFTTQQHLAVTHGVPGWPSYAVPLAVDLFLVWSVRSRRDVLFAVAVAVSANVAGVLTAESLASVDTWVSAGLHAVFPVTLYRMHRPARPLVTAEAPAVAESAPVASAPAIAPPAPAEAAPDSWPDVDLWQDFADSEADALATPPTVEDMRATVATLADRHGRPVTGRMVADHFGVSERTGRRYLRMAEEAAA
ncbi:transfer protein spdA [Streptomyces sp. NBC_01571]|uniref:transfer protein spdA n=1 Tax=Streptomyces sp. NBC_01571 TaxID=2975883 RepID=UPI0022555199|nr:transfer protein spdA [Streptomyces sp. NBC_01571]MCX4576569.1 transfer protein spdA [Streptomyces sp. NBC_01571]